ncbi:unnamed protein product [Mycena citricolor]|uniref:HTH La-type RNA-binding domain-containing protein n=1 Tax=Mycena citricolor TaxID=2018698 RepID=A0AAD2Q462_9AGAR|nr:unnamed protein product [Mycena citricolor]
MPIPISYAERARGAGKPTSAPSPSRQPVPRGRTTNGSVGPVLSRGGGLITDAAGPSAPAAASHLGTPVSPSQAQSTPSISVSTSALADDTLAHTTPNSRTTTAPLSPHPTSPPSVSSSNAAMSSPSSPTFMSKESPAPLSPNVWAVRAAQRASTSSSPNPSPHRSASPVGSAVPVPLPPLGPPRDDEDAFVVRVRHSNSTASVGNGGLSPKRMGAEMTRPTAESVTVNGHGLAAQRQEAGRGSTGPSSPSVSPPASVAVFPPKAPSPKQSSRHQSSSHTQAIQPMPVPHPRSGATTSSSASASSSPNPNLNPTVVASNSPPASSSASARGSDRKIGTSQLSVFPTPGEASPATETTSIQVNGALLSPLPPFSRSSLPGEEPQASTSQLPVTAPPAISTSSSRSSSKKGRKWVPIPPEELRAAAEEHQRATNGYSNDYGGHRHGHGSGRFNRERMSRNYSQSHSGTTSRAESVASASRGSVDRAPSPIPVVMPPHLQYGTGQMALAQPSWGGYQPPQPMYNAPAYYGAPYGYEPPVPYGGYWAPPWYPPPQPPMPPPLDTKPERERERPPPPTESAPISVSTSLGSLPTQEPSVVFGTVDDSTTEMPASASQFPTSASVNAHSPVFAIGVSPRTQARRLEEQPQKQIIDVTATEHGRWEFGTTREETHAEIPSGQYYQPPPPPWMIYGGYAPYDGQYSAPYAMPPHGMAPGGIPPAVMGAGYAMPQPEPDWQVRDFGYNSGPGYTREPFMPRPDHMVQHPDGPLDFSAGGRGSYHGGRRARAGFRGYGRGGGFQRGGFQQRPAPPFSVLPAPELRTRITFPIDRLREEILGQLEFYLSPDNMATDFYLRQQMDSEGWIPVEVLGSFKRVQAKTKDLALVRDVLSLSEYAEIRGNWVRSRECGKRYVLPTAKQSVVEVEAERSVYDLVMQSKSSSSESVPAEEDDAEEDDEEDEVVFVLDNHEASAWNPQRRV